MRSSVMMFDAVAIDVDPRVLAPLPYRVMRSGELPVCKSADRDGVKFGIGAGVIPERRSAGRAEMENRAVTTIADMLVYLILASNRHRVRRKPRLCGKGRATAPLAIIAMADRDAHRI